jgi:S1-C subfamily serine protease
LALGLGLALVRPPAAPAVGDQPDKNFFRALRSTVLIVVRTDEGKEAKLRSGTGALIDIKNRLVLTNFHVVGDYQRFVVYFPILAGNQVVLDRALYMDLIRRGGGMPGKTIAKSPGHDLALIQLDGVPNGGQALRLAAEGVGPGDSVHSIGNPGASPQMWVYTHRKVTELQNLKSRPSNAADQLVEARIIETDLPPKPGESGGPLVNDKGELVGITMGEFTDTKRGLFINLGHVKELLDGKGFLPKPVSRPPVVAATAPVKPDDKPPADEGDRKEAEAASQLRVAKRLAADGLAEKARARYEGIVTKYPDTKAAGEARELLEKAKPR